MVAQKQSQKPTQNFGVKLKNFIKNNYKLLLFIFFFFTINLAFAAIACQDYKTQFTSKRFILTIIILFIINIALCFFVYFSKRKSWPIEKIFLVVGSVLGLLYLFAIPVGRAPDEPAHIWRVYSISQGGIVTETQDDIIGNNIPNNIANFSNDYTENAYTLLLDRFGEPISEEQSFRKTIGSNPIDYTPHIIGMLIGRILHLPMLATFYLARLIGLIFCIGIIYLCLKYIPILKKPLFFISCLPLTMQTFISISYDGAIFCSAIALITFVLYSIYQPKFTIKVPGLLLLTLLCIVLTATKPVYFPLMFLLCFIPSRCVGGKKKKIFSLLAIFISTASAFLIWSLLSIVTQPGNGADTNGQIAYILANPIRYIIILIDNIINMPILYLYRFGGLEWLDTYINEFYIIGALIFFAFLCAEQHFVNTKFRPSKTLRLTTAISLVASIIFIFTAMYIQWTSVGSHDIEGVQTRYLLPIALCLPLICISSKATRKDYLRKDAIPMGYFYNFIIFLNINAISILLCAHF